MNHKWKDNVCINCGIKRKKINCSRLMEITNIHPFKHYEYGTGWYYINIGFARPSCKKSK